MAFIAYNEIDLRSAVYFGEYARRFFSGFVLNRSRIAIRRIIQKHIFEAPRIGVLFLACWRFDDLDVLKQAAQVYNDLIGKEYHITFSNRKTVRIVFKSGNFSHLAGLHKLRDLYQVSSYGYNAARLYKLVHSGKLTLDDLERSCYFDRDAYDRLESLCRILRVISCWGESCTPF